MSTLTTPYHYSMSRVLLSALINNMIGISALLNNCSKPFKPKFIGRYNEYYGQIQAGSGSNAAPLAFSAFLSQIQKREGICGTLGEIGVHHGRYFFSIALTAEVNEALFVCDVFSDRHLNIDGSGRGDKYIFLNHARALGINEHDMLIFQGASTSLKKENLPFSPFRSFSIDGGHTRSITYSDLRLAASHVVDGAIVAVDDFTNFFWLGVPDGVFQYMHSGRARLVPFLVGMNKLFFTTPSHHSFYITSICSDKLWGNATTKINRGHGSWKIVLKNWPVLLMDREPQDADVIPVWEGYGIP